jgi:uncharacterized damage-inducible protein DinB
MRALTDLFAYNAWANALMFDACRNVDQVSLDAQAPGTYGSLIDTLKHQVQVEVVYAHMLRDEPLPTDEAQDQFLAHDLAWYADTAARVGREYTELLAHASQTYYDQPLRVPWFDFALTKHDGLLQVLTHSAQHRTQVFSVLGQNSVAVPDVDFVDFVESKLAGGA